MAIADHSIQAWAPTDPTLAGLHDIDKVASSSAAGDGPGARRLPVRGTVQGTESAGRCPADFPDLAVFTAHKDALDRCGLYKADQLGQLLRAQVVAELGASVGEAGRLLDLVRLYELLLDASKAAGQAAITGDADKRAAAMTFLLIEAQLDRLADFRDELTSRST